METIFETNINPGPKGCNNNNNLLMDAKTLSPNNFKITIETVSRVVVKFSRTQTFIA